MALDKLLVLDILVLIFSLLELLLDILLLMADIESSFNLKSSSSVEDSSVSISDSDFISDDITSNPSVFEEADPIKAAELSDWEPPASEVEASDRICSFSKLVELSVALPAVSST